MSVTIAPPATDAGTAPTGTALAGTPGPGPGPATGVATTDAATTDTSGPWHPLQPALWPEQGISTETDTYFRLTDGAACAFSDRRISFPPGGRASFDTYNNLFNLGKWRDVCGDVAPALMLRGQGRFQLVVTCATADRSWERIFCEIIELDGTLHVPLAPEETGRSRRVLFFELLAMGAGTLEDFGWETRLPPRQHPELVVSITTFRREAAVQRTVARFRAFFADQPLRAHIRLTVVDNGQSAEITPGAGVRLVPNANLGGAGGFTRGLIEARAEGASHCLFMDDDASVHMEAIIRTWLFLAYSTDPRTTVAGAMINADHRWKIWENGAVFDRRCIPQFAGTDLRNIFQTLNMEFRSTGPAPGGFYGGWWFFAFPLASVTHLPFPFFVRGDDVSFSLANDLRIVTLPGVASVQESFTDKDSPLTWYLDLRSHLAHHLSLPQMATGWARLYRTVFWFYLRNVLRFHYDSLSAVNLAVEDVLRGPQFFAENADLAQRRQDLKALTRTEAWQPIARPPSTRLGKLPRIARAFMLLTLNGHFLPFYRSFGSRLVVPAEERGNFREIYGAARITYLNAAQSAAYTVVQDKRRFGAETLRFLRNGWRFATGYRALRARWQAGYRDLTLDRAFWDRALDLPGTPGSTPAGETQADPGQGRP